MIKKQYILITFLLYSYTSLADLDDFGEIDVQPTPKVQQKKTNRQQKTPDLGKSPSKPIRRDSENAAPENKTVKGTKKKKKTTVQQDKKLPINWSAKGLSAEDNQKIIKLIKNVVVTQGNLKLNSDRARVYFNDNNEVDKVVATGRVKVVKEAPEKKDRISARGQEATFYNETQMIILKGRATLWRGGDVIRGKQISYNLVSGMITVDNVEGVVKPEESKK